MIRRVDAIGGTVVLKYGREPQCRHPKLLEIVEMLAYALKVAPVTERRLRAVAQMVAHAFHHVVFRVAVGKAVGHEQIEHVGIGEALVVFAAHLPCLEGILHGLLHALAAEFEVHCTGLRIFHVHVYEQIVGAVEAHQTVYPHSGIVGGDVGCAYVFAVDHQLHLRVLHANEPVGGFDAVNLVCCVH